jgi:hypothetical protein
LLRPPVTGPRLLPIRRFLPPSPRLWPAAPRQPAARHSQSIDLTDLISYLTCHHFCVMIRHTLCSTERTSAEPPRAAPLVPIESVVSPFRACIPPLQYFVRNLFTFRCLRTKSITHPGWVHRPSPFFLRSSVHTATPASPRVSLVYCTNPTPPGVGGRLLNIPKFTRLYAAGHCGFPPTAGVCRFPAGVVVCRCLAASAIMPSTQMKGPTRPKARD